MCGRYANFSTAAQKAAHFDYRDWPDWPADATRYNIAPGSKVEVLRMRAARGASASAQRERCVDFLHWGLVPYWAKNKSIGHKMINARIESAHTNAAFRSAFAARRCLIVANGYYEWQKTVSGKQPYFITPSDAAPSVFAFGGLWERWRGPVNEPATDLYSCTILTTAANALVRGIHDRMPLIIDPKHYDAWLSPDVKAVADAQALIAGSLALDMIAYPVSQRVNSARADAPDLAQPCFGTGS